jgi:hypothetical protein
MKELTFEGEFNGTLLAEELFDAFPEWTYEREFNFGIANTTDVIIRHSPGAFIVKGPPEILDEKKISGIVDKHDPGKLSKAEMKEMEKEAKKDSIKLKLNDIGLTTNEIDLLLE